jgi:hypothetical protein
MYAMRMFDKVIKSGFVRREDAPQCTVVCIDSIAQHAEHVSESKGGLAYADAPFCRPPWNLSFSEFNTLSDIHSIKQAGALSGIQEDAEWLDVARATVLRGNIPTRENVELIVIHDFFVFAHGRTDAFSKNLAWACSADGTVLFYWWCPVKEEFRAGRIDPDANDEKVLAQLGKVVAMGFCFSNCANVKLEDVTEELQPEAKIRRRLKIPEVKRYTLNIAGHVARPSRDYNEGPQGVMPFHLCRGHFATYTAERPMFGNPKLVGRYWHPPHMKGKKENGEVIKDYAIVG